MGTSIIIRGNMSLAEYMGLLPGYHMVRHEFDALQAELEQYRWVPVEERLPEYTEHDGEFSRDVWVHVDYEHDVFKAYYCNGCWNIYHYDPGVSAHSYQKNITHWREIDLPEAT